MSKKKVRYELWREKDGYSFFPEDNDVARRLLSEGAEMIWEVEAYSHEEAQNKKHEFLNWEPYKPMA